MLGKRVPLRHPQPNPSGRLVNFTQNHVHLENKIKQTKKKKHSRTYTHKVMLVFMTRRKSSTIKTSLLSSISLFTLFLHFPFNFLLRFLTFSLWNTFFFVIISNISFSSSFSSPCCCYSSSSFSSWSLH